MIKSKKGAIAFPHAHLAAFLLIAIGLFLLFPFVDLLYPFIVGEGTAASCAMALYSGESAATACPVDKVIIYDDKVEINDEVWMKKGSGTTNEMVKEALAELLQACLSRGGGYNSRAFKNQGWYGSTLVCMECFHITIDKDVKDIKRLSNYLENTEPKGTPDKTYLDILTKDDDHLNLYLSYGDKYDLSPSKEEYTIASEKDYAIFFLGINKDAFSEFIGKAGEFFRGHFSDAVTISYDTYYAYLTESNNIGNVCEVKVN